MGDTGWNGHEWLRLNARQLEIERGHLVEQRRCMRCGRDFLRDLSSGLRYAVAVSILSFHRLADEVTERWRREVCPGERRPEDDDDRERKIAELPVSRVGEPQ
jgi:hypothetical protein